MVRLGRAALAAALFLGAWSSALAQQISVTGGVHIDAKGVLRSGDSVDPRLAEIRAKAAKDGSKEQLVYVSLPRLLAEARRCQEAGTPLPPEVRYVGGMVRLQYVIVYPEQKDLVIAGPGEPFDVDLAYRPLGKRTGRPVLQLDDVVTALRGAGPGAPEGMIGCDLETTQENVDRIAKAKKELAPRLPELGERKVAEKIAEAAGPQNVHYFGVGDDNRFALVCIEADVLMKRMSLGLHKTPVKAVKSYLEAMSGPPQQPQRFAFECAYDALSVSPDGLVFELKGPSLKLVTSLYSVAKRDVVPGDVSPAAKKFASSFSENFEALAREVPCYADLANLSDLALLAGLIARDGLHGKAGWDLGWVLDRKGYKTAEIAAPKLAETLCAWRRHGDQTIFVSGGVALVPGDALKNRAEDAKGALKDRARRPEGDGWRSTGEPK